MYFWGVEEMSNRCSIAWVSLNNFRAGVEAESDVWVGAVNQQDYAWVVFPTGRVFSLNKDDMGI
jgi:hypothetical protein